MKAVSFVAVTITVLSGILFLAPTAMGETPTDHSDPAPTETSRPTQESPEQTAQAIQEKVNACLQGRGLSAAEASVASRGLGGASGGNRQLSY